MDYVGKSVGYVRKSVGYAAITHTFQPMKSIRSDVPWYKYIYYILPPLTVHFSMTRSVRYLNWLKRGYVRKPQFVKAYLALFVCFATKAIHIEVVSDQSTAAFLAALKRFCARRGRPQAIYSDKE